MQSENVLFGNTFSDLAIRLRPLWVNESCKIIAMHDASGKTKFLYGYRSIVIVAVVIIAVPIYRKQIWHDNLFV